MKKVDLIRILYEKSGMTNAQAREAVDILQAAIEEALVNGEAIEFGGFGKLEVKTRSERQGINPVTKEKITIPESKNVSFKAAKALKLKLNKQKGFEDWLYTSPFLVYDGSMKNTKEYNKSYYQKNKEKILARQKAYRDEKREKDLVELTPEELEQQALLKKQKAN